MKQLRNRKPLVELRKSIEDDSIFESLLTHIEEIYERNKNLNKHVNVIKSIIDSHGEKRVVDLFSEYHSTNSYKRKVFIKHGSSGLENLKKTLSNRDLSRRKLISVWSKQYWLDKGFSEKQAIEKVSELQRENVKKRSDSSYKDHASKLKHSIQYWINRGYSVQESEILRDPHLNDMLQDKDGFIRRYGKTEGLKKYKLRIKRLLASLEESKDKRKSAGYVSKESLKFFIPLYKFCRKLGIKRNEIFLGVNGSREFFIRHESTKNHGRFFDFCIPSLNVVIEYNGTFWHPRENERELWKNPWTSFDDAMAVELEKKMLCESRNIDLLVVWSDQDLQERLKEVCQFIKNRYESSEIRNS